MMTKYILAILLAALPAFAEDSNVVKVLRTKIYWKAPLTNVDGSPINDLAGFRIYARPDTNFVTNQIADYFAFIDDVNPEPKVTGTSFWDPECGTNPVEMLHGEEYELEVYLPIDEGDIWINGTVVDFFGNESDFSCPILIRNYTPQRLQALKVRELEVVEAPENAKVYTPPPVPETE